VARKAIAILEEGMAAAENDEIRRRVEKVSIAPRTVLIDPFAKWVRGHNHQIASGTAAQAPPEAYTGIERELRAVFRLYDRHKVDRFAEWVSMAQAKAVLPERVLKE
jgi:hypothetical protein